MNRRNFLKFGTIVASVVGLSSVLNTQFNNTIEQEPEIISQKCDEENVIVLTDMFDLETRKHFYMWQFLPEGKRRFTERDGVTPYIPQQMILGNEIYDDV